MSRYLWAMPHDSSEMRASVGQCNWTYHTEISVWLGAEVDVEVGGAIAHLADFRQQIINALGQYLIIVSCSNKKTQFNKTPRRTEY